tara:strand:+ start:1096 stop:1647 length:552 start_codon:yes stop_codon:yes gene_type:complete
MGIIGKDFDYKLIKNFLSEDEINILSCYCEMRHRTNLTNFDLDQSCVGDTYFYGDPLMESLMLVKKNLMEKETGKKLLPTYAFWRTYTKHAVLKKHSDRPSCEISVTVNIDNDGTDWPIFMDGKPVIAKRGDAVIYLGCKLKHWREAFNGDFTFQTFLHYVDAEGPNKGYYMDNRMYWGIVKK